MVARQFTGWFFDQKRPSPVGTTEGQRGQKKAESPAGFLQRGSIHYEPRYFTQQALCALQQAPPVQQPDELEVAFVEPTRAIAAIISNRYFIDYLLCWISFPSPTNG